MRYGIGLLLALWVTTQPLMAEERLKVVVTFTILADFVERVGGENVEISSLIGPDGDSHVFDLGSKEAALLTDVDVVIANGLGFEPWLERSNLVPQKKLVIASAGIEPLEARGGHEEESDHEHESVDPHAFQDAALAQIYVKNIVAALSAADPAHAADYQQRGADFTRELAALDAELKARFHSIPAEHRRILTSHDAFQYFGQAYGVDVIPIQGTHTDESVSAKDMAELVDIAKSHGIGAVFLENMTDPRLAETVAREANLKIGGELYADALSGPDGPAPNYLAMMRRNADTLLAALR